MPTAETARTDRGTGIRAWRVALDWTLDRLAQETGYSVSYLSEIELGKRTPSERAAAAIDNAIAEAVIAHHARFRATNPKQRKAAA